MNEQDILHYGVQGMKWGVRRARRAEQTRLASKPNASKALIYNTVMNDSFTKQIYYTIKKRGVKEGRKEYAEASRKRNERVQSGKATVVDKLNYYGSTKIEDLFPVKNENINRKVLPPKTRGEKLGLVATGGLTAATLLGTGVRVSINELGIIPV